MAREPLLRMPEYPRDALTANNMILELAGSGLVLPNFQRVEGMDRTTETIEVTDGGVGLKYKWHGGITSYSDITVVRIADGSVDDNKMSLMCDEFVRSGKKYDGTMTKFHHGKEIMKVYFTGLCFKQETLPSFDNASANPLEMSYPCTVDWWSFTLESPTQK